MTEINVLLNKVFIVIYISNKHVLFERTESAKKMYMVIWSTNFQTNSKSAKLIYVTPADLQQ